MQMLRNVFIDDALKKIEAGEAQAIGGLHAGKAFRVVANMAFPDMNLGYLFTINQDHAVH